MTLDPLVKTSLLLTFDRSCIWDYDYFWFTESNVCESYEGVRWEVKIYFYGRGFNENTTEPTSFYLSPPMVYDSHLTWRSNSKLSLWGTVGDQCKVLSVPVLNMNRLTTHGTLVVICWQVFDRRLNVFIYTFFKGSYHLNETCRHENSFLWIKTTRSNPSLIKYWYKVYMYTD